MTPVSRYGSTPSGVTICTSSPISRPASSTVSASITTSSSACGGSPVRSNGVTSGSHELPIVGAPPPEITSSVCGSITCAKPPTLPLAAATSGTASTSARTSSGIGFRSWPPPPPPPAAMSWNAFSACTTTSVFAKMSPNRSSNADSAVSVRTSVPETKPTPRTIARAVSARRTFLARRLFSAARHISGLQRLHPVEDASRPSDRASRPRSARPRGTRSGPRSSRRPDRGSPSRSSGRDPSRRP